MHKIYIKKGQQGLNTSALISNTAIQQPNMGYQSWMSTMQKLPMMSQYTQPQQYSFAPNMNYQNYLMQAQNSMGGGGFNIFGNQDFTSGFSNALGQSMDAIAQGSSSPWVKGIATGVKGIGQHIIGSIGSSVTQSVGKEIGKQVLQGGLKGISSAGIGSAAKAGLSSGLKGALNAKSLGGVALSIANQFAPQKREYSGDKGELTKNLDSAYDTLSDAVSVIPGFGTAASLIMKGGALAGKFVNKWGGGTDAMTSTDAILGSNFLNLTPLGLVNGFGGKKANEFGYNTAKDQQERNYIGGDYSFSAINDAVHKSGKKYGFFSAGARRSANEQIARGNAMALTARDISQTANFRNTFGNAMSNVNSIKYQNALSGNVPGMTPVGKKGMKIEKQEDEFIIPDISNFKPIIASEEEIQKFKEGGSFNIIPEGALHARKNNMEVENITKKGIPVVDKDGVQQAEIERDEIIFRKEVTDAIEEARKDGSDKKAIEIGKLLVKEIFHNTQDNTGLIEDLTNETPTVKEQVENHEVFPVEKKQQGGQLNKPKYLDWVKTVSQERLSPNYDLEEAYNHLPFEELESWRKASDEDLQQGKFHLRSIYELPNGEYKFLKLGKEDTNPEVKLETDLYRNNETGLENTHDLVYEGDRYYYRFKKNLPKRENGGLIDQINNMDLTKLNSIEKDTLLQLLLQKASL